MTPYRPLTSHNGLSAVCVAHIMTPYRPLTSHNGLSAVCVAHIMTPYRPLTSHNGLSAVCVAHIMTPYCPLTSHNGLSAVCVAHIMTPYRPLTSHNGLSAVCVAHIMTPYRPLTSHNVQRHRKVVASKGGTPHVKISPNLNHPPLAEEVRHVSRNADSACPFSPSRQYKKGHAESAFRDACRTSSAPLATCDQTGTNMPPSPKKWGGGGGAVLRRLILTIPFHQHHAHYCIHTVIHTVTGRKLDIPGLLGLDEGFRYYHGCAGQITAIPPHQQSEREPEGKED